MARNRNRPPESDHVFPYNQKLLDRLNRRAYAGLPEKVYSDMYTQVSVDATLLHRSRQFDAAGEVLISKACATYEDLHIFCKKTRAELLALFNMSRDSNKSLAAKCYAALSYKHLAGERP